MVALEFIQRSYPKMQTQQDSDHALALLLAQEYEREDYYSAYGTYDSDGESKKKPKKKRGQEEENWNPSKKLGKKPSRKSLGDSKGKPKEEMGDQPVQEAEPLKAVENQPVVEKPVKKLKTVSEGMNTGKFTDEEVAKFKQGLEMYGRDWSKVDLFDLVGTAY